MQLIDRDILLAAIEGTRAKAPVVGLEPVMALRDLIDMVKAVPDTKAEEVTCCAECNWWNPPKTGVSGTCAILRIHGTGDFWCKLGQHRIEHNSEVGD